MYFGAVVSFKKWTFKPSFTGISVPSITNCLAALLILINSWLLALSNLVNESSSYP